MMQNNFSWYLKFHARWPTIFSQVQRSLKIYSIMVSLIWHHLCMLHFHRFQSLMSTRGHYLPQSDQSHVRCEVSKLREIFTWLPNRLTATGKRWFLKPSWIHKLLKQSDCGKLWPLTHSCSKAVTEN